MLSFTTNQWIVVGLVLVLGWLLGLLSHSGSRKWKLALAEERDRRIAIERDRDARLEAANARIAELERGPGTLAPGTAASIAAAANGTRDDLSLIRGIDGPLETRLNEQGVHSFRDVARLTGSDAAALEIRLGLEPGRIAAEHWAEQAEVLARGGVDEHRRRWA